MGDSRAALSASCGILCILILAGMLVSHAWPLWTGELIYLEVRPVDPRDLFRGDYVMLGYEIHQLAFAMPGGEPAPEEEAGGADPPAKVVPAGEWMEELVGPAGEPHYQRLNSLSGRRLCLQLEAEPSDEPGVPALHRAASLSDRVEEGRTNLCGRVEWVAPPGRTGTPAVLMMRYGIDALFVQEGTGAPIERAISEGRPVFAEIAVTASGRGRLRDLVVDGAPLTRRRR